MSVSFKPSEPLSGKLSAMTPEKITTILIVESIEACLPTWQALGYSVSTQVPHEAAIGFVILTSKVGELMLQTRASLREDLPRIASAEPRHLLYAHVASLSEAEQALSGARVLVDRRTTFYGATETWLELPGGTILCVAKLAA
jgi:hypothetical protein